MHNKDKCRNSSSKSVVSSIIGISKYGNLELDISPEVLRSYGFSHGDILSISKNGGDAFCAIVH